LAVAMETPSGCYTEECVTVPMMHASPPPS
jgi:hypothetical protein